ncbi:MFS transporter [Streptomyces sp. NPDC054919]
MLSHTTSPSHGDQSGAAPRGRIQQRLPALLRQTDFRRFWTAQTVSYLGDQVTVIALPMAAVLNLGASATEMGFLAAAGTVANLLFPLHAGALVDRRGRRRATMIVTDLSRAVLLATVPLAFWLGILTLAQLFVVAFLTGMLTVLFNICAGSLFAAVVPRERYVEGNSLVRGSYSFSWVVGPSAGGTLVQILSAPLTLVIDVISFIGSAILLRSISPLEPAAEGLRGNRVREGLAFVRQTPALLAKFAAGTSLSFFHSIYFSLIILFASRELGLSGGMIGLTLGAGAFGALLGSVTTARTSRRIGLGPAFIVGSFIYPATLALIPLAPDGGRFAVALMILAQFGAGFGLMLCDITGNSIQQALTPGRLLSRVQGAYLTFSAGVRPFGALAGGVLGSWLGLRPTLWIAVIGGSASILPLLPSPLPRMRELPDQLKQHTS